MLTSNLSVSLGSSQYQAIANDSLKDQDNAAWLMEIDSEIRHHWLERISWIRLVDRLAEQDLLNKDSKEFQMFHTGWKLLHREHRVDPTNSYQEILHQIEQRWFTNLSPLSIRAWNRYVEAIAYYHQPALTIPTLKQYQVMLRNLSGSFFQIFPFLAKQHYHSVSHLGTLDQFYNNLRDIYEDSKQGISYFPRQLLKEYGITPEEIYNHQILKNPGYYRMMKFFLEQYLPSLHRQCQPFIKAQDLHPSWLKMKEWSLHRYSRIEGILKECDFNYILFYQLYWTQVQDELEKSRSSGVYC